MPSSLARHADRTSPHKAVPVGHPAVFHGHWCACGARILNDDPVHASVDWSFRPPVAKPEPRVALED